MYGRGTAEDEAEQDQPCQAVHSPRLDHNLHQTTVPYSTTADDGNGIDTVETLHPSR